MTEDNDHGTCLNCASPATSDSDYCIRCQIKQDSEDAEG
jgi:predicted amidophosphoribosyltransferase